jgi:hypothetical protein
MGHNWIRFVQPRRVGAHKGARAQHGAPPHRRLLLSHGKGGGGDEGEAKGEQAPSVF